MTAAALAHGDITLHGTSARSFAVIASVWTAGLQLFSPTSLAYRAAGDGSMIDFMNVIVLCVAALAAADVVWRDILRRGLIWPNFPGRSRHQICVLVYSTLSATFGIRAFLAAGDFRIAFQVGGYYTFVSVIIALEALALAKEKRSSECQSESSGA